MLRAGGNRGGLGCESGKSSSRLRGGGLMADEPVGRELNRLADPQVREIVADDEMLSRQARHR